ncbi:carbohydrate ABC transporter permease [Lederbergia galactosidilytica]|uniref:Lactose ABC transporter permease n=1 Tax=Lederbergia galactosidilytica TaxID=217031 RepID=A0A0Q9YJ37_9BACI|nr:sugar ABC transporter permease [Lederbergia galactosidilytica]KRG13107.1 lactose ABC transporter permease [Virgibacillus soli]KRG17060.1 lactose ABC transporter permease [Lederbergia galactosidilytica]MBP1916411.1 lactose/L-arabinose transport system permease protein [Lederbergia galactosidilytica]OAK75035.1 lactose ABC transporter permease [Lederbergia galactosidilytica]
MSNKFKNNTIGWSFVLVATFFIVIFYFYPMIQAFILSFKSGMGNNLEFVGMDNYTRLFGDPTFIAAIKNTFIYLIFQVPIMIILALIFSVLLNDPKLKLKGFFRTAIFLPAVTSLVAYSIIFKYLFGQDGIINQFLLNISLISEPIQWLTDPVLAKVTIIIAITWRWTGYNMIFYLSGLQNIDQSIYEAARIDGANVFQIFTKITVPALKPIILFTSITSTIGTLQLFDEIMNITKGGPGNATVSISQYIYNLSFKYTPDFGYAAAVSFVIVILIVLFSALQFKAAGDRN